MLGKKGELQQKRNDRGSGLLGVLYNSLTFPCFTPFSLTLGRVREEKPVIQEVASEPESSGISLFFRCVFRGIVLLWVLGWAEESLFAPRPPSPPTRCLKGKLCGERAIAQAVSEPEKGGKELRL